MGKDDSDYYIESETGNWNMSANYIADLHEKLKKSDKYRTGAKFGCDNLFDNFSLLGVPKDTQRLESLTWLVETLIELVEDTMPCLKKSNTKSQMEAVLTKLKLIKKKNAEPLFLYKNYQDLTSGSNQIRLNPVFNTILLNLTNLRTEIIEIMNKNDLIFAHKEEFSHKDFKAAIKDRIRNRG